MTGQEYRAAILTTGLSITDYAKHIGLTRQGMSSRFNLAKVTNEMALAVERVADRWRPIESAPIDGTLIIACRQDEPSSLSAVLWDDERWMDRDGDVWDFDYLTHWKPLPKWEIEP
jgi:hypothetical protein